MRRLIAALLALVVATGALAQQGGGAGLIPPSGGAGPSGVIDQRGSLIAPSAASGALTPYLGQIATRTYLPDNVNLTNKQLRARSVHTASDDLTSLTLVFPNFYVDGFGAGATYQELGPGAASTLTAAVEYPLGGTPTAVTCPSGGVIANISTITCTWTGSIPKGSLFGVRTFYANTGGVVFSLGGVGLGVGNVPGVYQLGDVLDAAASGLQDNTTNTTIAYTSTSGTSRYSPIIIAGSTTLPAVLTIGDSRDYGEDDAGDSSGNVGEVSRWISPLFANANWGIRGRDAGQFNANCTIQCSFANYFTHLVNQDGVNGFIHGQSAATVATNETALGNKFPTLVKFINTIVPAATSTDNYATLANQTLPTYAAGVATENTRRRTSPAPYVGFFDDAAALESSQNSGLVAVQSGGTGLLGFYNSAISSVHPVRNGYLSIAENGNFALGASAINRNGSPIAFTNRLITSETDHAEDATSQVTYNFSSRNFLIGPANLNRWAIIGCTARLGTTSAASTGLTIGGVSATLVTEVPNVTGGALTLASLYRAALPAGNTATISITYNTTMLRAGCDVYTAVGLTGPPSAVTAVTNAAAGVVTTTSAITIPIGGAGIVFASTVNGSLPAVTPTNYVTVNNVLIVGGTLYYTSGQMNPPGSWSFTSTFNAGSVSTQIAALVSP